MAGRKSRRANGPLQAAGIRLDRGAPKRLEAIARRAALMVILSARAKADALLDDANKKARAEFQRIMAGGGSTTPPPETTIRTDPATQPGAFGITMGP